MRIRDYKPGDAERLRELYLASRKSAFHWIDGAKFNSSDFETDTRGEIILVAEADGKIIGFSSSWLPGKFIHHLHVNPDHVRTGVGSALLHATLIRTGKPSRLKCLSRNQNALVFYRSKGWVTVGEGVSEEGAYYEMEFR